MQTILFFFRRLFIFLADLVLVPLNGLMSLWSDPNRGRAMLFGLPAIMMGMLVFATVLWSWVGFNQTTNNRYVNLAEQSEADAMQARSIGDEALAEKHLNTARVYWDKLRNLQPDNLDYKYGLFGLEMKQKRLEQARGLLMQLAPDNKAVHMKSHLLRAELALRDPRVANSPQRLEEAQNQLGLALSLDPNLEEAKLRLADVWYYRGNRKDAFDIFEEYYIRYPIFIFKMYAILSEENRLEEAEPYLKKAIESYAEKVNEYPNNIGLWERYIRCFVLQKQFDEARSLILAKQQLLRADKELDDPNLIAEFDKLMSQLYSFWAISVKTDAVAKNSFNENVVSEYLNYLKLAFELNNESIPVLQAITELGNSEFPQATEARQLYDPRVSPESAEVAVLLSIGNHELVNGKFDDGVKYLTIANEKAPNTPVIANNLAFALRLTDAKKALELINGALKVHPKNPRFLDTRAHIYMSLAENGDSEKYFNAISDFKVCISEGMLERVETHRWLAYCLRNVGLETDAIKHEKIVKDLEAKQSGSTQENSPGLDNPGQRDPNQDNSNQGDVEGQVERERKNNSKQ